mmetsp:Transcript_20361/g.26503  ORF Transcript_20361/g.26503 Transcript_20361/m.26503 type:complete len:116 (-) Transcript_20361:292-639(-)
MMNMRTVFYMLMMSLVILSCCSIGGAVPSPAPSHSPTISDCSCSHILTLNVLTDNYPSENSYSLRSANDKVCPFIDVNGSASNFTSSTYYSITVSSDLCFGETYEFIFLIAMGMD